MGCMPQETVLDLRWHNAVIEQGKETSRDNTHKASSHEGDRVSTEAALPSETWNAGRQRLQGAVF